MTAADTDVWESHENERMRTYYRRVFRRAWDDTWGAIGSHVGFSVAVLAASALLGFFGARSESVSDIAGAIVVVVLVWCALFVRYLISAPVHGAWETVRDADERAKDLEAQIPNAHTGPFAEPKHEGELRAMLQAVRAALDGQNRRPDLEPLDREMFVAHFADLDDRLARWDAAVARNIVAPGALAKRFVLGLQEQGLDELPYIVEPLAKGLAMITEDRSLRGGLDDDDLPPAYGTLDSIWRGWWGDDPGGAMFGQVGFRPTGTGTYPTALYIEGVSESELPVSAAALLNPVYELLGKAQKWDEAHEILSAREALRAFPRESLLEVVKRMQLKPKIVVALRCPGCG